MIRIKPDAGELSPGWGSVGDSVEQLRRGGRQQPSAGRAAIVDGIDEVMPERLEARAYWWRIDAAAKRASGDVEQATVLDATDVLVSAWDDGQLLALISSRNAHEISTVSALLERTLGGGGDDDGGVSVNWQTPFELPSDFFLWGASRANTSPEIGNGLLIDGLDGLSGQDVNRRTSVFGSGVKNDRPEVLALIALSGQEYGPAKMGLVDSDNLLRIHFSVWPDGSFRVFKKQTECDDETRENEDEDAFFIRVVMTFAYNVHGRLRDAYHSDSSWRSTGRTDFIDSCATLLRDAVLRRIGTPRNPSR